MISHKDPNSISFYALRKKKKTLNVNNKAKNSCIKTKEQIAPLKWNLLLDSPTSSLEHFVY